MPITIPKLAAVLIAVVYVALAAFTEDTSAEDIAFLAVGLLFPLALIWFPEALGRMTGYVGYGPRINTETPPAIVAACGWFLLLGGPVLVYWLATRAF